MTFTVDSLTRCTGLGHYTLTVTIGAQQHTVHVTAAEVQQDFTAAEMREQVLTRLRSAAKEANAGTFAQIQAALVGNTYKI